MSYGELKIDTITFTAGGVDASVSVSGLVQNPTFTGNITTTGTISGDVIKGNTVSGAAVTGDAGEFGNLTAVSGVFTTQVSGATVTGNVGLFGTITGGIHTLTSGVFASGTATNPSITFVDDLDTGLYSPGADQLALATNGTGRLFVDASGNVGVGSTSTNGNLTFSSSASVICTDTSDGSDNKRLVINGGGGGFNSGRGGYIALSGNEATNPGNVQISMGNVSGTGIVFNKANGTPCLNIDSDGKVGVGTSSPADKLHISGSNSGGFRLTNADNSDAISVFMRGGNPIANTTDDAVLSLGQRSDVSLITTGRVGVGTTSPGVTLEVDGGNAGFTGEGAIRLRSDGGGSTNGSVCDITSVGTGTNDSALAFSTRTSAGGITEKVRIDSSGRLGVGSSSPGSLLELSSAATSAAGGVTVTNTNAAGYSSVQLKNTGTSGRTYTLALGGNTSAFPGTVYLYDDTAGAARVAVDSSGRFGIGTTAPVTQCTVYGSSSAIQFQNTNTGSTSGDGFYVGNYGGLSAQVWQYENDVILFGTNNTERVRLDSSGRLLVGTTIAPTAANVEDARVVIEGNTGGNPTGGGNLVLSRGSAATSEGQFLGEIHFADTGAGYFARIACEADGTSGGANGYPGRIVFSTEVQGSDSGPNERMRITNNGSIRVAQTTSNQPAVDDLQGLAIQNNGALSICTTGARGIEVGRTENDAVSREVLRWYRAGSLVQTITTTATTVSYPTGSDYRLKENVVDMTGAIDRVKQLSPKRFNFIVEPGVEKDGFIAHELETVVPQAVVGTKDQVDENGNPVWQGVDHSFMVPLLTGALQEAIAKIETLEAKVAALEAN